MPGTAGTLAVLGDLVEDVVVWASGPLDPGTDTPARIFRRRGGSAANVAAGAALLGAPVRFLGRVGADRVGEALVADLAGGGVDVRVQRHGTTGCVVVLVDADGERTMLPDRGAAAGYTLPDPSVVDGVTLLHLPAYGLLADPCATAARGLAARVRDAGGAVSVDVSSTGVLRAYGPGRFLDDLAALAPAHLLANRDEADLLGLPGTAPPRTVVVIKDGGAPARVWTSGPPTRVPAERVDTVRDTTGAGDAFAAGYLTAVLAGARPVPATAAGHRSAARVLAGPGAGGG
ncbi:PfkB family carbohydrate kinase [Pseudonocardia sp. NPDC046786]|uniref:carbohydrate kinase family protein n=1 Tax=Pseudonocardia sp. NPDC046786 TaxID=3155471 RepID=UPI0033EAB312